MWVPESPSRSRRSLGVDLDEKVPYGDFLRCGGQARTVSPVDVTAVRGSQLTYCVEVAAELLADVEEQTVRSVHQAQRPGRESPCTLRSDDPVFFTGRMRIMPSSRQ